VLEMRNVSSPPTSPANAPERSGVVAADLLPKAITAAALLSSLSYGAGWLLERTYYSAIGCDWFFPNLTPTHIAAAGVPILATISLFAAMAGVALQAQVSERRIERTTLAVVGLASTALVVFNALFSPTGFDIVQLELLLQGSTWGTAGVTAALAFHSLVRGEFLQPRRLRLLLATVVVALVGTAVFAGLRAIHDLDPSHSSLTSLSRPDHGDWRLVATVGDLALATALSSAPAGRSFMMFKVDAGSPVTTSAKSGVVSTGFFYAPSPSLPASR
jgi:hypothetical protein